MLLYYMVNPSYNIILSLCLPENSLPKPKSLDTKVSHSVLAMKSGERESASVPSSSSSSSSTSLSLTTPKEHKSAPVIVPLIKPSTGSGYGIAHDEIKIYITAYSHTLCAKI